MSKKNKKFAKIWDRKFEPLSPQIIIFTYQSLAIFPSDVVCYLYRTLTERHRLDPSHSSQLYFPAIDNK